MNSLERFLFACRRLSVDRPPVWLMRQAGRYLPEYRQIRANHDFLTICRTPELITEVSLQPWLRFNMDAVIVFSDILLPLGAMGPRLKFEDETGPHFDRPVRTRKDVENLAIPRPRIAFQYLFDAIEDLSHKIDDRAALIGFIGSPWTLACYLIEGRSGNFNSAQKILLEDPQTVSYLMEKITAVITPLAVEQIRSGADVIQIFDTWGHLLTPEQYRKYQLPFLDNIISEISRLETPSILFARNSGPILTEMLETEADVIGIGAQMDIKAAFEKINGRAGVQGNLDPEILLKSTAIVEKETQKILDTAGNKPGFIMNLGHGVLPSTPVEAVETFVDTAKKYGR